VSRYADIDFHLDAVHLPLAPSLRLRLVYDTALDSTASLNLKRGGLGQLGDGIGDARPIFDRKLLSQGCFELQERYGRGQYQIADDRCSHAFFTSALM